MEVVDWCIPSFAKDDNCFSVCIIDELLLLILELIENDLKCFSRAQFLPSVREKFGKSAVHFWKKVMEMSDVVRKWTLPLRCLLFTQTGCSNATVIQWYYILC
jgi:hypothetical protein